MSRILKLYLKAYEEEVKTLYYVRNSRLKWKNVIAVVHKWSIDNVCEEKLEKNGAYDDYLVF